jgi:Rrf2 family protein
MRVTTWAEYGMIVSVGLARRVGQGPVAARQIAEQERLPADYVEQILLRLRRAGLVSSVRGVKGGYLLARDAAAITARDVIQACEGATFEVNCDARPVDGRCTVETPCGIRPLWRLLARRIDDVLESVTVADLLRDEASLEPIEAAAASV